MHMEFHAICTGFLGCAMSAGKYLPTFWRSIEFPSTGSSCPLLYI